MSMLCDNTVVYPNAVLQAILDATTLNYEKFRLVVTEAENLKLIEVPDWAGLGAVQ